MGESRKERPSERLIQTSVLGPMLNKENAVGFEELRLQRSRQVILDRVSVLASHPAGPASARPRRIFTSPWRYAFVMGMTTLVFFSAGASAYFVYQKIMRSQEGSEEHKPLVTPPGPPKRNVQRRQSEVPIEKSIGPAIESNAQYLDRSEVRPSRPRRPSAANQEVGKVPSEHSELDAQREIFGQARVQAAEGRHQEALLTLKELDGRYPKGSLTIESRELRAGTLYQMGRYADAARTLEELTKAPVSAGKKAQFFRLLGDARSREGQCGLALESYRRALGLGLEGDQAEAARMGMRRCASR